MRVILCGYYGQDNAGDEALLVCLLQMLPATVEPVVLSANPQTTRDRYGVEAYYNRDWGKIWQLLGQCDGFIWGGGSLMQDVTSVVSPLYYGGLMAIAQMRGLKTIAWAQGIGPLQRPPLRWFTQQVLRGCSGISVRDEASLRLVDKWDLNAYLAADPVWSLAAAPMVPPPSPLPMVAVNLRAHRLLTLERLAVITQALQDFQQQTQTHLRLIPLQKSQDLAIAEAIAVELPGSHEILYRPDPRQCKGLFRGAEFTIGMRLHSLIMAAAEGSACFALSYDPKVSRLMAEVGLPGGELTDLPMDSNELSQIWQGHFRQRQPWNGAGLLQKSALQHQALLQEILVG
ncbi:polysaccharide pyruvyl transferase CsaB [Synechocystis salina LEGE 06155]|nr:polysaccharide pyruvyl transferase CsaB [Synechocystis salina LEGE 06155]